MKTLLLKILFLGVLLGLAISLTSPFQSCKKPKEDKPDTTNRVYKPNIYIYPKHKTNLIVNISFPKGGKIVKSIPVYNINWNITVDSIGKIDNKYDYLFYESDQPNEWQYKTGWFIEKENLKSFFQNNMTTYGFNTKEIKDFIDYWIPRLTTFKFYLIYPQEKIIIDKLVKIDYSTKPDNLLRLFYVIQGTNEMISIDKHTVISNFTRENFYITEWGVILK